MRNVKERKTVLDLYFLKKQPHKAISEETGIPLNTVKSWTRRYRIENGMVMETAQFQFDYFQQKQDVEVRHNYRSRIPSKDTAAKRIARLEMEVELLRNFISETERRSKQK